MQFFLDEFIKALTNGNPGQLPLALLGLVATAAIIWTLKGRLWAFIYVALIPFLNWTFGRPSFKVGTDPGAQDVGGVFATFFSGKLPVVDLTPELSFLFGSAHPIIFNPLTVVTGFVFVVRDFVQREMGHRVLVLMALAIAWSFYYSWPVIALASAIAFAISESADWAIYTFTKYRLSTRILLSSAIAAPIDTTVFLYGADLARQMQLNEAPGTQLNPANWILFIIGKMVGALIVSWMIRRREDKGEVDPAAA